MSTNHIKIIFPNGTSAISSQTCSYCSDSYLGYRLLHSLASYLPNSEVTLYNSPLHLTSDSIAYPVSSILLNISLLWRLPILFSANTLVQVTIIASRIISMDLKFKNFLLLSWFLCNCFQYRSKNHQNLNGFLSESMPIIQEPHCPRLFSSLSFAGSSHISLWGTESVSGLLLLQGLCTCCFVCLKYSPKHPHGSLLHLLYSNAVFQRGLPWAPNLKFEQHTLPFSFSCFPFFLKHLLFPHVVYILLL